MSWRIQSCAWCRRRHHLCEQEREQLHRPEARGAVGSDAGRLHPPLWPGWPRLPHLGPGGGWASKGRGDSQDEMHCHGAGTDDQPESGKTFECNSNLIDLPNLDCYRLRTRHFASPDRPEGLVNRTRDCPGLFSWGRRVQLVTCLQCQTRLGFSHLATPLIWSS